MKKLKDFITQNKLITILSITIIILLIVSAVVNLKSSEKDEKKIVKPKEDFTTEESEALGINSNSNSNSNGSSDVIADKIKEEQEKKEEESKSDAYKEYEKLTEEEKEKIDLIPSKNDVPFDVIDDLDDKTEEVVIPEKFNLADKIKLNYESQGEFGLCWAFSSMKSLETFLALNGYGEFNFSEIAVDYLGSDLFFQSVRDVHEGGQFEIFIEIVSNFGGVVEQSLLEYRDYTEKEYANFLDLTKKDLVVTDYVKFPTIIKINGKFYDSDENELTDEDMKKFRELMKKHIMKYGSLATGVLSSNFGIWNSDFMYTDHGISLVGWDDNYPKEKFCLQTDEKGVCISELPKENGAFIYVNSWLDQEDFLYLSYEDAYNYYSLFGVTSVTHENSLNLNEVSPNLRHALLDYFSEEIVESNGVKYLTKATMKQHFSLDLSGYGLTNEDLTYLKGFEELNYLDISDNNITDVSYIPNFKRLWSLYLNNNKLTDISNIGDFKELQYVDLSSNNLTSIDVLSKFTKLYSIEANNNNIQDISALSNLKGITLSLSGNKNITGYEKISFENIDLSNCNLSTFGTISEEIDYLNLSNNPGLQFVSKVNAHNVVLDNSNYRDLIFLNYFEPNITSISLKNNEISDISPLKYFPDLRNIDLSGNKNIKNFEVLKEFNKEDNSNSGITNSLMSLFKLNKYTETEIDEEIDETEDYEDEGMIPYDKLQLYLSNCDIEDITVFNELNNVGVFDLSNNKITSLKGFNMNYLDSINLSNNNIKDNSYNVLFNKQIYSINLSNCGLTNIDSLNKIDKNNYYGVINLSDNNISDFSPLDGMTIYSLSIAGNPNVTKYFNSVNELYSLNLSNTGLKNDSIDLSKYKNDLSYINVSNNPEFTNYNSLDNDHYYMEIFAYGNPISYSQIENLYLPFVKCDEIIIDFYSLENGVINLKDNMNFYKFIFDTEYDNYYELKISKGIEFSKYHDKIIVPDGIKEFYIMIDNDYIGLGDKMTKYKFVLN